jgi:hypothetical protein
MARKEEKLKTHVKIIIFRVVRKLVKETREKKNICGGSITSKTVSGGNLKLL